MEKTEKKKRGFFGGNEADDLTPAEPMPAPTQTEQPKPQCPKCGHVFAWKAP